MNNLRVITVVGTRPEIIRLSRVICELEKFFDHKLIHTGQNYDYEPATKIELSLLSIFNENK